MENKIVLDGYPDDFHNPHFLPLLKNDRRYMVLVGGAGSGKSKFAALKVLDRTLFEPIKHRILLIRKVAKTIKRSQFQILNDFITAWQMNHLFDINKSDMTMTYIPNGNQIITAGLDDSEKLKSIEHVTGMWIEETSELTYDDFSQCDLRLRGDIGTYKQIIMSLNPVDVDLWINDMFQSDKENVTIDHSTVDDNEFIDKEYIAVLDNLATQDKNKYNIYRLGLWGQKVHIIYDNYEITNEWPEKFDEEIFGMDFGFNNPSAILQIRIADQEVYEREFLFETKLTNTQLIGRMESLCVNKKAPLYADSAEPARIDEIAAAGYNIHSAMKSVEDGIDYCKTIHSKVYSESSNYIKELKGYSWKMDKNGKILDEPVKFGDHLVDCRRYALYTHHLNRKKIYSAAGAFGTTNREE